MGLSKEAEALKYLEADPIGIQKGSNHLYVYGGSDPVTEKDPLGLDSAGCDLVPDVLEIPSCVKECCARHDKCYDEQGGKAPSWLLNCAPPPVKYLWPEVGQSCNDEVVLCLIRNCSTPWDDPSKPNFYCAKLHTYIRVPGDYPDYNTAYISCKSDE